MLLEFRISIHAAREGGDVHKGYRCSRQTISIHAAREGGDNFPHFGQDMTEKFQSTPPVKAATFRLPIRAAKE